MSSSHVSPLPFVLSYVPDARIFSIYRSILARLANLPVGPFGTKPSPGSLLGLCPFTPTHRFCNADARFKQREWNDMDDDDTVQFEIDMDTHEESMHLRSPSIEIVDPDILPMSDADISRCMNPITRPAKFNPANPSRVSFEADTLRSGAEAVIALLHYSHSPPGSLLNGPSGVRFDDYLNLQPICFLDVRTTFHM